MMRIAYFCAILSLLFIVPVYADGTHSQGIKIDGTIGNAGKIELPGPDYAIKPEYGKQAGSNLFHSFQQFNIHKGESATFSGPASVQNIISRVTGGKSWIDGLISSEIAGANLYFLNPAGVMFGPNANLDISGSFHVSTADYLRLGNNGIFHALHSENSILSVAPPAAFGFLSDKPAPISFQGSFLQVPEGKTLSVVGGDIYIKNANLYTSGGQINVASIGSEGEAAFNDSDTYADSFKKFGEINVIQTSESLKIGEYFIENIDVSGSKAGNIYIRGEKFVIDKGTIKANTRGDENGGGIDIKLTGDMVITNGGAIYSNGNGSGRVILIEADNITLSNKGMIETVNTGTESGTDIQISVNKTISINNDAYIFSETEQSGCGSNIKINANNVIFESGGNIENSTYGSGHGGNTSIYATDSILISGKSGESNQFQSGVYAILYAGSTGDAGEIFVKTPNMSIKNGGVINGSGQSEEVDNGLRIEGAKGRAANIILEVNELDMKRENEATKTTAIFSGNRGSGKGGNIEINGYNETRADSVLVDGNFAPTDNSNCQIGTSAANNDAGSITINSHTINLINGVNIQASVENNGNSGDININADKIILKGGQISNSIWGAGHTGNVIINADSIIVSGNSDLQNSLSLSQTGDIYTATFGSGDAGRIEIQASTIEINDGGRIMPFAGVYIKDDNGEKEYIKSSGKGGELELHANTLSLLNGGYISTETKGTGDAGKITIDTDSIVISGYGKKLGHGDAKLSGIYSDSIPHSKIKDDTTLGNGGKIEISTSELTVKEGGSISCESQSKGNAGNIDIKKADKLIIENSSIKTSAELSDGGNISIKTGNMLQMNNGAITTSVNVGEGNGGNIAIEKPELVAILNNSKVIATAKKGSGGNITIASDNFINYDKTNHNIDASSQKGISGNVEIQSPDTDVSAIISVLPQNYIDASQLMMKPCESRISEKISKFVTKPPDAFPLSPEDWQPSPVSEAVCGNSQLLRDAYTYQTAGHHRLAESAYKQLLAEAEKDGNIDCMALAYSALGDLYLSQGRISPANKQLQDALDNARKGKNYFVTAGVLNNLGNAFAVEGESVQQKERKEKIILAEAVGRQYSEARKFYREGMELIENASDSDSIQLKAVLMLNSARVSLNQGNSLDGLPDIFGYIGALPDSEEKAWNMIVLSRIAFAGKNKNIAFRCLSEAKRIAGEKKNNRIVSYAAGYAAQIYETEHRYSEAADLTRQAIFAAQESDSPEILYLWQWQSGKLFGAENAADALESYQAAADILNPESSGGTPCEPGIIHQTYNGAGYRSRKDIFAEYVRPFYMEYLQIRIDQARKESDETLEQQKLREIVEIIESFKTAELGSFYKDDCMAAKQKKEIRLEDIPQDSAVLYSMLVADKPIILLMRRDRMKLIGSPPELRNIQITIDDFTRILRENSESNIRSRGQRLYKSLIAPVEPELQGITTLVIVPDGALRLIPFSVLHDGEQYLLEKYSVVTLPAITLTDLSQRPKLKNPDVLLGGLSEARHGFSALPDVEKEFAGIRKIFGDAKILMNRSYNKDNLKKELIHQAYHYVVMSTHGNFGSSTEDTFVLTYDEKLDSDMLESLLTPLKFGKNPVELLTLSASETGIGDERAALGLGGIAVKAGVRSAMATLWKVESEPTSQLVAEFFRQLAEDGVSKAEALRKAQMKLIADTKYHHPRFWAPFLLIGNWM